MSYFKLNAKMDKFEFIEAVLKNHKLTPNQLEKIIQLASKELKTDIEVILGLNSKIQNVEDKHDKDKKILKLKLNSSFHKILKVLKRESGLNLELKSKVTQIENEIKLLKTKKETSSNDNLALKKIIVQHQPGNMIKFLNSFSNDEHFKWFTHNPDNPLMAFNYQDYLKKAKEEFPKQNSINFFTYSNVSNFLFDNRDKNNKKRPSFYQNKPIKHTWVDVEEWCAKNENKHPFDAIIDDVSFSESINNFKHAIEFRIDESDKTFFRKTKKFIRENLPHDFKTEFTKGFKNTSKSLNSYIDTNMFFRGLKQILIWIKKNKSKSDRVLVNLSSEDEFYKLEITHLNSYFSLNPKSKKILGVQGDFHETRKNFFSVLDWQIIGSFKYDEKDEDYKITCLNKGTTLENGKKLSDNLITKVDEKNQSVKHIIKIYKTTTK